jgi:hypothetical protein
MRTSTTDGRGGLRARTFVASGVLALLGYVATQFDFIDTAARLRLSGGLSGVEGFYLH